MSKFISVDADSLIPPFAQILEQLRAMVQRGELKTGDHLPTVRQLAADLGVAPNTVAKAFADLESDGWVRTEGRRGTIVAARSKERSASRANALREASLHFLARMSERGYTKQEIRAALDTLT